MDVLDKQLDDITKTYNDIQGHLRAIDPAYALNHTQILSDIGGFAHDGLLFYCPPQPYGGCQVNANGTGMVGRGAIILNDQNAADAFIGQLEKDADQIQQYADQLVTQPQLAAGKKPQVVTQKKAQ
ncbi:hypothetical protein [Paraburkholderia terrae]|uniref:hypothetical protein n=1 Tax=Paraburkholderia terrae TaxID=311230 RepID=UPI0020C10BDD|nr:hypothetical protein [Paraburkholderia terrae]